jgi:hypothetical protein
MLNFDFSDWSQKEFNEFFNREIPHFTKMGKYNLPNEIEILKKADEEERIDLSTIGFFFNYDLPVDYFPVDIIPFAATGGDSCFFAFLTDYQLYDSIYDCPIVFISPCDGDEMNYLFAKNFKDFLSIMMTIYSAENIRFNNPRTFDFEQAIKTLNEDYQEYAEEHFVSRNKTVEFISNLIGQEPVKTENLNTYFTDLYDSRSGERFITTKDSFNLKLGKAQVSELNNWVENPVSESELKESLSNASELELKVFLRNMPYVYEYFKDDYQDLRYLVMCSLPESFVQEKAIIQEQIQSKTVFDYYLEWSKNENDKGSLSFETEYSILGNSEIEFDWEEIKKQIDDKISIEFDEEDFATIIINENVSIDVINLGFPVNGETFEYVENGENSVYVASLTCNNGDLESFKDDIDFIMYILIRYSSADYVVSHETSDLMETKLFLSNYELGLIGDD